MSFKDIIGWFIIIPFGLFMWLGVAWLIMDIRERQAKRRAKHAGVATDADIPTIPGSHL